MLAGWLGSGRVPNNSIVFAFSVAVNDKVEPRQKIEVTAVKTDGTKVQFDTLCRIDTPVEVDYYRNGGILHTVLRKMAAK